MPISICIPPDRPHQGKYSRVKNGFLLFSLFLSNFVYFVNIIRRTIIIIINNNSSLFIYHVGVSRGCFCLGQFETPDLKLQGGNLKNLHPINITKNKQKFIAWFNKEGKHLVVLIYCCWQCGCFFFFFRFLKQPKLSNT